MKGVHLQPQRVINGSFGELLDADGLFLGQTQEVRFRITHETKTWKPLLAPANATGGGPWEVETRSDGTKQWSYKGSPLYTYVGDKKPCDIEGNNRHEIVYGDAEGKVDLSVTGGDSAQGRNNAGSGFYWHLVTMVY